MRDLFKADEDDKMYVTIEIRAHGRTRTFSAEYDDDVQWADVLDEVIATVESSYGYCFDVDGFGLHHEGK